MLNGFAWILNALFFVEWFFQNRFNFTQIHFNPFKIHSKSIPIQNPCDIYSQSIHTHSNPLTSIRNPFTIHSHPTSISNQFKIKYIQIYSKSIPILNPFKIHSESIQIHSIHWHPFKILSRSIPIQNPPQSIPIQHPFKILSTSMQNPFRIHSNPFTTIRKSIQNGFPFKQVHSTSI